MKRLRYFLHPFGREGGDIMELWVIITIVISVLWLAFEILDRKQKKKVKERLKEMSELHNSDFEI